MPHDRFKPPFDGLGPAMIPAPGAGAVPLPGSPGTGLDERMGIDRGIVDPDGGPPVGILQALRAIHEELQLQNNRAGRTLLAEGPTGLGYNVGEVPIAAATALTTFRVVLGIPTRQVRFLDWPIELSTFDVRINSPEFPPISILRSGRSIVMDHPFKEIFITTSIVGAAGVIRFITGGLLVHDQRPVESPPILNRVITHNHIEHTMVGANGFHFVIPNVPAGEVHRYYDIGLRINGTAVNYIVNVRTLNDGVTSLIELGNLSAVGSTSRLNLLSAWSNDGGGTSETMGRGTVDVFPGGRLEIGTNETLAIGNVVILDYFFETLPAPASFVADGRTLQENEVDIPDT